MCNGICGYFKHEPDEKNHYCQKCSKFIPRKSLTKENKEFGRLRCNCCNGLVRHKPRVYKTNFMPTYNRIR